MQQWQLQSILESAHIFKHLENTHGGKAENKNFEDYFEFSMFVLLNFPFSIYNKYWTHWNVPIRSDQDIKVETCLLNKQSI